MFPRKGDCCSAVPEKSSTGMAAGEHHATGTIFKYYYAGAAWSLPPSWGGWELPSWVTELLKTKGSKGPWGIPGHLGIYNRTKREIHTQGKKLMPISSNSPRSPWLPKTCVKTSTVFQPSCSKLNNTGISWTGGPFFLQSWNSVGKRITLERGGGFM